MIADKSYLKPIGQRLMTLRATLGFRNREQFAEAFGAPKKTFEKYEQGLTELPTKLLLWLSTEHHVNLDWLVTGEGQMLDGQDSVQVNPIIFRAVKNLVQDIHETARITLNDDVRDDEAIRWYNELVSMTRGDVTEGKLRSLLSTLEYEIQKAVNLAVAEPGTGKREAS